MAYNKKKNLLESNDVYNRYYGDFRGVDFSSDHTQVHDQRLAYAVNMFKDYRSGQGGAIETIPGFRRRVELPDTPIVYALHYFQCNNDEGKPVKKVLIHAGDRLYLWHNYPKSINVVHKALIKLPEPTSEVAGIKEFDLKVDENVERITRIQRLEGEYILSENIMFDPDSHALRIMGSDLSAEDELYLFFKEGSLSKDQALFTKMNLRKSVSFAFHNRLYILDGKNYLMFDGEQVTDVLDDAYIPTTYINIIPSGENADAGKEHEQRNILQSKFKHTFVADGTNPEFTMNEKNLDEICEVKCYGTVLTEGEEWDGYEVDLQSGIITLRSPPERPEDVGYPEGHAGIEITAKKSLTSVSGITEECTEISTLITNCTIATVYDDRVFLSGNPAYPNEIFYCGRNLTGYVDPTYFGILNHQPDGAGNSPIVAMMPVADTLMVLKEDSRQEGSVYFHTPTETGIDLYPTNYPSKHGLNGVGCVGPCINFLDDPIFISRLGVEAMGQLSVRYERAVEHRSSLIDAKLANLDLSSASLEVWNGYLLLMVDGKVFMADSRQTFTHDSGTTQYEWYYLEGIGVYEQQYAEYRYSSSRPIEWIGGDGHVYYCTTCKLDAKKCTCENEDKNIIKLPLLVAEDVYFADTDESLDLRGTVANPPDDRGSTTETIHEEIINYRYDSEVGMMGLKAKVFYKVHEVIDPLTGDVSAYQALLCEAKGNKTGGRFYRGTVIKSIDENLFFGTQNGVVCSFNFDMRDEQGAIAPKYYHFDERTILCGCATKMDCCNIPHLTKNTVKKSTVVKTKSLQASAAKIKVRTNKKPYEQIARINSAIFSFDDMNFTDFSFTPTEQSLFAVREKEKKWVEKQYYIYSDEYQKPFALYYISFRYIVAGRYKE